MGDLVEEKEKWIKESKSRPALDFSDSTLTLVMQSKTTGVNDNISNPEYRHGYYAGIRNTRIALQLSRARLDRGMSVLQLCKRSKVPQKTIKAIEAGRLDDIQLSDLTRIAAAFDIGLSISLTSDSDFIGGFTAKDMSIPSYAEEIKSTTTKQEKEHGC